MLAGRRVLCSKQIGTQCTVVQAHARVGAPVQVCSHAGHISVQELCLQGAPLYPVCPCRVCEM